MRDDLKNDLNDARRHMKAALRSTVVAVRGGMDAAIDALDGDADASKPDYKVADFDLRALLNHTVASLDGLADAATGSTWDLTAYGRDVLGDDPRGTFLRAARAWATCDAK